MLVFFLKWNHELTINYNNSCDIVIAKIYLKHKEKPHKIIYEVFGIK